MARKKTCKTCGEKFMPPPRLLRASVCSPQCGILYGREMKAKADRRKQKERKIGIRSKTEWFRLAQVEFNKWIRMRDAVEPCISCGRYHQGQYHAGHYRTTAAQPALRFNELNCHKQCSACNLHLSGNIGEFRIALVKKIGAERVDWLEIDHKRPAPWTIDEIKEVRAYYKQAQKDLAETREEPPF